MRKRAVEEFLILVDVDEMLWGFRRIAVLSGVGIGGMLTERSRLFDEKGKLGR